jgi:hypothetical protein
MRIVNSEGSTVRTDGLLTGWRQLVPLLYPAINIVHMITTDFWSGNHGVEGGKTLEGCELSVESTKIAANAAMTDKNVCPTEAVARAA